MTREPGRAPPRHAHGDLTSLAPHERLPAIPEKIPWRRDRLPTPVFLGFSGGSDGKESACNAGDPSSILGSGRSSREGIGYPFQYSWVSLAAQTVKNLPAMRETWVQSLGQEDPLEEVMATHSSILAWRIPMDSPLAGYSPCGCRVGHDRAELRLP